MVSLIGPRAETWSDSDEEPEPPSVAVYRDACLEAGKVPCGRWLRTCQTKSEECTLQHYGIGKKGSAPLGKSLRVNACVRVLDLSDNGLGTEGVQTLAKALLGGGAPALTALDLSQNQAGPDGAAALGELLAEQTAPDHGLQSLRFDNNAIGNKGAGLLTQGLTDNRRLAELHLCRNEIGCDGAAKIAEQLRDQGLAGNASVTTLSLEWNQIRVDGCRALLGACREGRVEVLDLGWNGVRDEACVAVAQLLHDGGASHLRELRLHHNHVSATGGAALGAALGVLEALDVSGNPLAAEGVSALLLAHQALERPWQLVESAACPV